MSQTEILNDIKMRLLKMNIHEVRQVARKIGVSSPTDGKKGRIIDDIIAIASLEVEPAPPAHRGAPPKSEVFDEDIVNDIKECMKVYAALREGREVVKSHLSDGTEGAHCAGLLAKGEKQYYICAKGCISAADDIFVPDTAISRFNLKEGDYVEGECKRGTNGGAGLTKVAYVNGAPAGALSRKSFENFTPVYPSVRINLDFKDYPAARMTHLFAPVGKGQRAVISAPENSGKITLIKQIASAISRDESITLVLLLIAESPEAVTDIKRSVDGAKIFHTPFEVEHAEHVAAANLVAKYCKNTAECGDDVVLIVSGLSKLKEAAKQLLSTAICAEEGPSVTVIATVGSEGEYLSEYSSELLSYANMRLVLSNEIAADGTPAIDILNSHTANCELLQDKAEILKAEQLRREYRESGDITKIMEFFK